MRTRYLRRSVGLASGSRTATSTWTVGWIEKDRIQRRSLISRRFDGRRIHRRRQPSRSVHSPCATSFRAFCGASSRTRRFFQLRRCLEGPCRRSLPKARWRKVEAARMQFSAPARCLIQGTPSSEPGASPGVADSERTRPSADETPGRLSYARASRLSASALDLALEPPTQAIRLCRISLCKPVSQRILDCLGQRRTPGADD